MSVTITAVTLNKTQLPLLRAAGCGWALLDGKARIADHLANLVSLIAEVKAFKRPPQFVIH